jgi:heat shock protein HtpX
MGGSFISLYLSKWMAKKMAGVQVISKPSNDFEKWYLQVVERQSSILNIKIPEIGIFQSAGPNAFATGSSKNNSLIAISSGLVSNMSRNEIEAVIGHEMSHVANGDMVTLALIQGIVNIGYFFTVIFAQVVLGILASTIVMWYSRQREYRADYGGAMLTSKDDMIASLRALEKCTAAKLPDQMLAFGISNKGQKSFAQKYFSSHPPLAKRIERLQQTDFTSNLDQHRAS